MAENTPSYATVREETNAAMQEIVDQLPLDAVTVPRAEQEPYSCGDTLSLGSGDSDSYFYTGNWDITLPDGFDVPAFIDQLPTLLGDGWGTQELSTDPASASVYLVQNETNVTVDVIDTSAQDGSTSTLNLTGISRCGVNPDQSASPHAEIDLNSDLVGTHSLVASSEDAHLGVLREVRKVLSQ